MALASNERQRAILVEDIVSAHKVAAAGFTAIPLFGTQVHKPHLYYLMQQPAGLEVVLWLDKDQQGTIMRKALGLQTLLGVGVKTVSTDKDPKSLSIKEIKDQLNG
jgi:DNA primase